MNQETVAVVSRYGVAELLQRPLGGAMRRHVTMQNLARRMLHDHEHIQEAKRGCDDDTKITSRHRLGMGADKRQPALRREVLIPTAEQPKSLAMPADERRWLPHSQRLPPVEPMTKPDQRDTDGRDSMPRLDVPFAVERELFTEEEVFCGQCGGRA